MLDWQKSSWREKPRIQMPDYPDKVVLEAVEKELATYPPLVFAGEVRALKRKLAKAARGEAFLLQGGDCAEAFDQFNANAIRDTFKVILQMAVILTYGAKVPVVKLGRIAGQFAKPRSSATETQDGVELPSYRGDIINSLAFDAEARVPNPKKMLRAYTQAAGTLNLLRAFSKGGYADVNKVHRWTLDFIEQDKSQRYEQMARSIDDALQFISAAGLDSTVLEDLKSVDFYVSHESLLLEYEEALTREDSLRNVQIAGSAHMIWIGDRTRQPDGAHVEFCRGVSNPIGLKCGPSMTKDDLRQLLERLNPENEEGRLTLIARFGAGQVGNHLPDLIETVKEEGANVLWVCDPMHGNTIKSQTGYKTRPFEAILSEVREFFSVHRSTQTIAGGVHFEMTGMDVTECTGGMATISDEDLSSRYHTACDPRLNASQSIELAFLIAEEIENARKAG